MLISLSIFFLDCQNRQIIKHLLLKGLKFVRYQFSLKNIFIFFRPIVQSVERAAHDGFVVGSIPAGPICL